MRIGGSNCEGSLPPHQGHGEREHERDRREPYERCSPRLARAWGTAIRNPSGTLDMVAPSATKFRAAQRRAPSTV